MNLTKISLLSIQRQLGKRLFLLVTLALSLCAVLSLLIFVKSQEQSIEKQFDEYGANIIVTPRSDQLSLSYGGIAVSSVITDLQKLNMEDSGKIYEIPNSENIRAVSPKLVGAVEVHSDRGSELVVLVGVLLEEERKIKSWWDISGKFPEQEDEILMGWDAAQLMGIHPGDTLEIAGVDRRVSGVLNPTGNQDDQVIMASLPWVGGILNKEDQVSLIDVSALCSDCPIEELVLQISTVLPDADVKALRQVMNQRMTLVMKYRQFALTLALLISLLSGFLTFSVMSSSVAERHKEIGIFRALGFSRKHILQIIQRETLIITLGAALLGEIITLVAAYSLLPALTGLSPEDINLSAPLLLIGVVALLLLSLGASLIPAMKAAAIDPVESINSL